MPKELSYKLLKNYLFNFFSLRLTKHPVFKPLFFTHYVTLKCNFKCKYCEFSKNYTNRKIYNELTAEDSIKLFNIIYKACPNIYFTGGEPLLRNDIIEIVRACKLIGFKSISINTNMSLIHDKMLVLDYITNLVASFDVVNEEKYSNILGVSPSTVSQTKSNILECAKLQKEKKFVLTVNCVIIPETIEDVREVMAFCFDNNIRLAIVPAENLDGSINAKLQKSRKYRRLIEDIILEKKRGMPILGSLEYLYSILDFKQFDCYPTLSPHSYPDGSLLYPCQPMLKTAANILKAGSYQKALNIGLQKSGFLPMCKNKCFKACYIEPSVFMKNPMLLLKEYNETKNN
jgi:MoaA/NifB/PqqE/SkfB family radical SAM enzyme